MSRLIQHGSFPRVPAMPRTQASSTAKKSMTTYVNWDFLGPEHPCSKIQFAQLDNESTGLIIDLGSILKHESCTFCRLLFLALCLPENDPLRNDEIQMSIQRDPTLQAQRSQDPPHHVSFATWARERGRSRISDAKWPFGYTYDNVGMSNSQENPCNQEPAEIRDAVEFKEESVLNKRRAILTARHTSVSGLATASQLDGDADRVRWYSWSSNMIPEAGHFEGDADRGRWYNWASTMIPNPRFLDAMSRNKVPAALKLVIYGNQHEKSGIIEAEFWGAPKSRGRAILALSTFNLRIASPRLTVTQDRQLRYGRLLDETKIDLDLCHSWLGHCRNNHGEICSNPPWVARLQRPHGLTFRLIDVNRKCLIERDPTKCNFAALSYVWGASEHIGGSLRLETSNVDELIRPGGVDFRVGATIWDAIAVAESLKMQYLWADRLCIVQDNDEDKAAQIRQMDRIYGNAVVTIVAATSKNLHAGIPGVTTERYIEQLAEQVCSDPPVNVLVPIQSDTKLSPWDGRAWTFQEKWLSKRLLIFHTGKVDFHCRCGIMREDMTARDAGVLPPAIGWLSLKSVEMSSSIKPQSYEGQPPRLLRAPIFAEYAALIEQYTPRRMSNSSDSVSAILSLLKILVQSDHGRATLLHGLVEEFFDQALHWQPAAGKDVRLRLRAGRDGKSGSGFPTWSWAAWEPVEECPGGVRYEAPFQVDTDDRGALKKVVWDDALEAPEERIRSLLRWYIPKNQNRKRPTSPLVPTQKSSPAIGMTAAPPSKRSILERPRSPPSLPPGPRRKGLRSPPPITPKPARLRSPPILRPMNGTGLGIVFKANADLEIWYKYVQKGTNNLDQSIPKLSPQLSSTTTGECLVFKTRSAQFRLGKTRLRTETLWWRASNASDATSKLIAPKTLHIYETPVLSSNGLEVGRVVLPDPVAYRLSDTLYDFIILSEAQYFGDEENVDIGDHPLLNIMMIQWDKNRTSATRLAIGKMNKKDWWSAPGKEELVVLK